MSIPDGTLPLDGLRVLELDHTARVLEELGLTAEEIDGLATRGAIHPHRSFE